ncbi:alcohol dehydrogenase [Levilactobacillus brevis]|uniref:alcohol dehydrogenase n=1 Tax=Levilactobacillus brevis TaxID=1580 RepID=UPI0020CEB905|nr:alcohol dehydrogenase [Levilactobacillus brevis]MCP9613657.1 alcohol dehydrogenase [Levilactobacillus brevis]
MRLLDLTGQQFGRLTVIRRDGTAKNGNATWLCKCNCGNLVTVDSYRLRHGITVSCGCYRRDISKERLTKDPRTREQIGNAMNLPLVNGSNVAALTKLSSRNISGVIGVSFDKRSGKWAARLFYYGRYILNQTFTDFDEAVEARRRAEEQLTQNDDVQLKASAEG